MGCISATTSSKNDDYVDDVDYVHRLSQPLRHEYLVAWYIRKFECKTNVSIPKEIILLCEAYFEDTIIKSQTQMDEKFMAVTNEHKVCFLGAGAVGLSSLIVRLVMNIFKQEYDPTIEDWYRYCMVVDGVKDTLDILDTAGQEEFSAMQDEYFRQYNAFVLVYSITSKTTFDRVQNDYEKIQKEKEDSPFVVVLCGNKIDLEHIHKRVITTKQGQDLANKWNNVPFIETSAKTGENVRELFEILIREERARKRDYGYAPNYSYYTGQHAHTHGYFEQHNVAVQMDYNNQVSPKNMPLSPVYGYQIQSNVYNTNNTNNMSPQQQYSAYYIPPPPPPVYEVKQSEKIIIDSLDEIDNIDNIAYVYKDKMESMDVPIQYEKYDSLDVMQQKYLIEEINKQKDELMNENNMITHSSHHSESVQSFKWITNDNIQINKLNIPSPNNDNENDNDTSVIGYNNNDESTDSNSNSSTEICSMNILDENTNGNGNIVVQNVNI